MDSVENICNHLARYKVLDADTIKTLRGRWKELSKDRGDQPAEFKRWLTKTGYVSDFQLDLLTRGFGDHLFIEDYKLMDRIAKGRHAGVFQAIHNSGQVVAIKVLPPSKAKNTHVLGRFMREARLAMRLDHDNVIRTFHHGESKQGTRYIVMEFLAGETLEELIERRKRIPPAEAIALILQALEGLQHLHDKGLVHRDLKPANIMLVPPRAPGDPDTTAKSTLKILDIGLSRALFDEGGPDQGDNVDLTKEGTLLGTMNYMAPEQARDARSADIRSDIYGLGCVMYELLSGQPPFPDKNFARQVRRHAEEKPRPLTETTPGVPSTLDAIVQKMLAKDPAMRQLTPGQAIKDFRAVLATLGETAAAPRPERPLRTFMTWLETKRHDQGEDNPNIPVPIAGPSATATKIAAGAGQGTVLGPGQSARPTAIAAPAAAGAAPAPAGAAGPSAVQATSARIGKFFVDFAKTVRGLSRRDWILVGSGALTMIVIYGIGKLFGWMFSGSTPPTP